MSDISMSDDDRRRAVESRFSEMFHSNFTQAFSDAIEKLTPEQAGTLIAKLEAVRQGSGQSQGQQAPPSQQPHTPQSQYPRQERLSAFDKFVLGRS